jgi:hypothetical protein
MFVVVVVHQRNVWQRGATDKRVVNQVLSPMGTTLTRSMSSNYDPKPGRWMLPLVVLAMVAFTYIFVRELPSAATSSTVPGNGGTTTITTGTTVPGETTTSPSTTIAPEAEAYVGALDVFQTRLTDLQTSLSAANTGFDADPRTVSYDQAEAAFVAVSTDTTTLSDEIAALVPPAGFEDAHATVVAAAQQAVEAIDQALTGLRAPAPDTGEGRRAGVQAFDAAAEAFSTAVDGIRARASGA